MNLNISLDLGYAPTVETVDHFVPSVPIVYHKPTLHNLLRARLLLPFEP